MSEGCRRERESFTNPSLSPRECLRFDDQGRPSVITANMEDKQRMWDEKAELAAPEAQMGEVYTLLV